MVVGIGTPTFTQTSTNPATFPAPSTGITTPITESDLIPTTPIITDDPAVATAISYTPYVIGGGALLLLFLLSKSKKKKRK